MLVTRASEGGQGLCLQAVPSSPQGAPGRQGHVSITSMSSENRLKK